MDPEENAREVGELVDPEEMAADRRPGEVIADKVNEELFGRAPGADTAGITGLPTQRPVDTASESQVPEKLPEDVGTAEKDFDDPRHVSRGMPHMSSNS